jgi:Uma2 family endonuclease
MERESEERHEYLDGEVYAMAGESPQHGDLCSNLVGILNPQLRGTPCRVWTKDTKVRSGPIPLRPRSMKGLFSYPDIVVVCGEPQFLDEHQDVLLNPPVIIEVLSPTTEAFDRGEKFWRYRTFNPSLTDYLVVAQHQPSIEHFTRQSGGLWVIAASVHELGGAVELPSINCLLPLTDVYDRMSFPEPDGEPAEE